MSVSSPSLCLSVWKNPLNNERSRTLRKLFARYFRLPWTLPRVISLSYVQSPMSFPLPRATSLLIKILSFCFRWVIETKARALWLSSSFVRTGEQREIRMRYETSFTRIHLEFDESIPTIKFYLVFCSSRNNRVLLWNSKIEFESRSVSRKFLGNRSLFIREKFVDRKIRRIHVRIFIHKLVFYRSIHLVKF